MSQWWRLSWPNDWAAPEWILPAAVLGIALFLLVLWSNWQGSVSLWVRVVSTAAKTGAIVLLVLILVEPMRRETRPQPGTNLFVILADNSQSLQVRDRGSRQTRAERLQDDLRADAAWQVRLGQDFDVRRYVFDQRVRAVADFAEFSGDGNGSSLVSSLRTVAGRYAGRPTAGILLLTDGNATDLTDAAIDWSGLPPVYPVVVGDDDSERDITISRVSVSQTNFEAAPVIVSAEVTCHGYAGRTIATELLDEAGHRLEVQLVRDVEEDRPFALRFQVQPEKRGVLFYQVRAYAQSEEKQFDQPDQVTEATLVNNGRLAMVDRGGGPYRVLYVTGRPNWEYKFLRRAISKDDEVQLVGLVRIAKREPKFTFRSRDDENNPLFRGFGPPDTEQVEQYDEPVLIRLDTTDEEELRNGFPKSAEQLFKYHAIIVDDLEAGFFTQDQKSLIQQFVAQRGGGFLMLGGLESYAKGDYARTPIGELLPVYVDHSVATPPDPPFKLALTREGLLETWVRVRSTEDEELQRLAAMPGFKTVNLVISIKPGASVLARVTSGDGATHPALVVQRFGNGRSAALLVGDLWRWQLHKESVKNDDLEKSWRQMVRWLVADVPHRVEIDVRRKPDDPNLPIVLNVKVRDEMFKPLDNASVVAHITTPGNKTLQLTAEPADEKAGEYQVTYVPRLPGSYRANVIATAPDGSEISRRETGWVSEPATDEFRTLKPNRDLLERIARETGGEVIRSERLDRFVASLPNRQIPVTETRTYPVWHTWFVFGLAIGLLVTEWGLRRWKGLP